MATECSLVIDEIEKVVKGKRDRDYYRMYLVAPKHGLKGANRSLCGTFRISGGQMDQGEGGSKPLVLPLHYIPKLIKLADRERFKLSKRPFLILLTSIFINSL